MPFFQRRRRQETCRHVHRYHQQNRFVKQRACQNPQDKFAIRSPKYILHGIKRHCQSKIISDGIQTVKIISSRHKQIQRKSKIPPLVVERFHKKEYCHKREQGKDWKIIVIAKNLLHPLYNHIESQFRRYIPSLSNELEIVPVDPIIISHRNPACRYPRHETINRYDGNAISCLLPIPPRLSARGSSSPDISPYVIPVIHPQSQSHCIQCQKDINPCACVHTGFPHILERENLATLNPSFIHP